MAKQPILNLDDLFGLGRPIVVQWQGREYSLPRPDAFGPAQLQRFDRLRRTYGLLAAGMEQADGPADEPPGGEWVERMTECVDQIVALLSPRLAEAGLPFLARVNVIRFYYEQLAADSKKVEPPQTTSR